MEHSLQATNLNSSQRTGVSSTPRAASPYYSQSNGLAKNAVKQAEQSLERCKRGESDLLWCFEPLKYAEDSKEWHDEIFSPTLAIQTHAHHAAVIAKAAFSQTTQHKAGIQLRSDSNRRDTLISHRKTSGLFSSTQWFACKPIKVSRNWLSLSLRGTLQNLT